MTFPQGAGVRLLLMDSEPAATIEAATHLGFSGVELAIPDSLVERGRDWAAMLRRDCDARGLSMAVHAPSIDLHLDSANSGIRAESTRQLVAAVRLFGGLVDYVTVHAGYTKRFAKHGSLERLAQSLHAVCQAGADAGVRIAIENVYERTTDELLTYFDLVESTNLRMVIDLGHAHAYGALDTITTVEVLGDRVVALHLSDNAGTDDQHLPLGAGTAPLAPAIRHAVNTVPGVTMTVEARNKAEAARSLGYLRNLTGALPLKG